MTTPQLSPTDIIQAFDTHKHTINVAINLLRNSKKQGFYTLVHPGIKKENLRTNAAIWLLTSCITYISDYATFANVDSYKPAIEEALKTHKPLSDAVDNILSFSYSKESFNYLGIL